MSAAKPQNARYRLTLFIVGTNSNSMTAKDNLRYICGEHLAAGSCSVRIVDILEDFQTALDNDVFVTPTLLIEGPRGRSTILGNLSQIDRIVLSFGDLP